MIVHLVDGTYELFRYFLSPAAAYDRSAPPDLRAVRGVVGSILGMLEEGATHLGVATDHVIESFRNRLWADYKTGEGIDPLLFAQFPLLEDALVALGVAVWPMVEVEADDALASAAHVAAAARASSASNSTIGQTTTPSAASASSSGPNCAYSSGSMPSPVL